MTQSTIEDEKKKSVSGGHGHGEPDPEIPPGSDGVNVGEEGYVDPELEKVVLRKLDKRIPLLLAALCTLDVVLTAIIGSPELNKTLLTPRIQNTDLLSYLDRSNIGNAKIAGMEKDLELEGNRYSWLLTIFYISYTLFQVLILVWKAVPAHYVAACTALSWYVEKVSSVGDSVHHKSIADSIRGTLATCQAAVQSWEGEMAIRFLLGAAEAGFASGSIFLLSFFYRRHELGLRCGLFLAAAPLANTFAGALAYGITSGHPKFASWRLLFLVEGIPTVLMTPVAFYFLPDHPAGARFLNKEEKEVAKARAMRQVGHVERTGSIHWSDIGATVLDAKAWIMSVREVQDSELVPSSWLFA